MRLPWLVDRLCDAAGALVALVVVAIVSYLFADYLRYFYAAVWFAR
jgi:hypothetical protein